MKIPQHIQVDEVIRQRRGKPCKHCGKEFPVGEQFLVVKISTGFGPPKTVGGFHPKCWEVFFPTMGEYIYKKWHGG